MGKLYKQSAESATRSKTSSKFDEFFVARIRLTLYYSVTAIAILGISSFIAYKAILSNLTQSILSRNLNPGLYRAIIEDAKDILLDRFLTVDIIIILFIIVLGFFLTEKTLKPIKSNIEREKRFIADASHELRTPITVIMSGLEVNLSNKNLDISSAKKTMENTLEEMREFSKLSNDLLDISKYSSSQEGKKELLDIGELLASIVEKDENLAKLKDIKIEKKISPKVMIIGDRLGLSRLFLNILDNSIKYSKEGGVIYVSDRIVSLGHLGANKADKYIIKIKDTGEGIDKEILDKIFDPFFRGDASRNTAGAGLGLTLAKKIVESHKGSIEVKSEKGQGTEVSITLPISS